MKSRRHRAIDKAEKEIPMIDSNLKNRVINKWLSKEFKKISKIYYIGMSKLSIEQRI